MTANIFGERFLGREAPAWWDIEGLKVFGKDERLTVTQVMNRANLDYQVELWPVVASGGSRSKVVAIPDKMSIVRQPTADDQNYRVFGVCGKDYQVVQNCELAAMMDPISDLWPVETAGALGYGEKVFFTLDAGQAKVGGTDELKNYFAVINSHEYGKSLRIIFTPVRIVCQNTLSAGIRAASITALVPHNAKVQETTKWRMRLMADMQKAQAETLAMFDKMAQTKLDEEQTEAVVRAAFRDPNQGPKTSLAYQLDGMADPELVPVMADLNAAKGRLEYAAGRAQAFRDGTMELLAKFNDEFPQFAGTAWAAYNAVAECSDWRNGGAKVAESTIIGPRAHEKERAFQVAWAFSSN